MRHYLSTLHQRSHTHRKRFALVTAGSFTLLIFAIWALATFGNPSETSANAGRKTAAENPFVSLIGGVGAGFNALFSGIEDSKEGLETVRFNAGTLNSYGE